MTEGPVAVTETTEPDTKRADWVDRNKRHHGQLDALDPEVLATKRFLVIGAGAIGSFFTNQLAKMGASKITVVDDDTIEEHNISNQNYPTYTVGMMKLDALGEVVKGFSDVEIVQVPRKFTEAEPIEGEYDYVVSCVDSLEVRRLLWNHYKDKCEMFIDGRMGLEVIRAYAVNPKNPKAVSYYEDTLEGTPVEARCTAKTIMYTVNIVAGILLSMVKQAVNKEKTPVEVVYSCREFFSTVTYR